MIRTFQTVHLKGVPIGPFDEAVSYLADVLRECQLVIVQKSQGQETDPDLARLAEGLVPDLEELRELFRTATVVARDGRYHIEVPMSRPDAGTLAHLQLQLIQLRLLGRRGRLLVAGTPEVTQILTWLWDEAADQLHGRAARPYPAVS